MYSSGVAAPSRQISMELVSSRDEFQLIISMELVFSRDEFQPNYFK